MFKYQFHCNNCYQNKTDSEGCFTNNVKEFMQAKESSCLDGTWKGLTPFFHLATKNPCDT